MIRNIVGTLLVIGDGKAEPGFMEKILEAKDRNLAGPTAKPHGLVLKRIWY
jgi:tRNA pseudouridine38-40 synthase